MLMARSSSGAGDPESGGQSGGRSAQCFLTYRKIPPDRARHSSPVTRHCSQKFSSSHTLACVV